MELIDKDALVAEIERLKKTEGWCQVGKDTADVYYARGFRFACERIISFIDTLEVKEVDLEKELHSYCRMYYNCDYPKQVKEETCDPVMPHIVSAAKHFFELGLSASNPTTAADKGTAEEIIINLKRVENDYRIDLTKEIEWVRNKVKRGE